MESNRIRIAADGEACKISDDAFRIQASTEGLKGTRGLLLEKAKCRLSEPPALHLCQPKPTQIEALL